MKNTEIVRSKHYVVRCWTGFMVTRSKKEAIKYLNSRKDAYDIIQSQSKNQNYHYNNVKVILNKGF